MENLSNMCICLHGSGARRPPYTHYSELSVILESIRKCRIYTTNKNTLTVRKSCQFLSLIFLVSIPTCVKRVNGGYFTASCEFLFCFLLLAVAFLVFSFFFDFELFFKGYS